ncbi:DNA double-strand break repair nuclease NurA [Methanohalophilus sp. WG1-DM]|uniref:DNA double-strand break repair nuclease NurA n=1 Tax=Methanohalophilus sp. WG1-DM TaxID=2491675 RepID=UPI000FFE8014|nr:DNA double-strand break repair nuclease NurA [Methanohalophilus sp. WG1-DM]RXG33571.1 NurA domain protein [Methanohalophilus sp. WG1-DM]
MSLEPIHIKAIQEIASGIEMDVEQENEDSDANDLLDFLKELKYGSRIVLKSIGRLYRGKVDMTRMSQSKDPVERTLSSDSGSTNTFFFDSGLALDFCHCAMASSPSDLDIHSKRTIVAATYSSSANVTINTSQDWRLFDRDNGRSRLVKIEAGLLETREKRLVHNIALYLSESEHILWMKDIFTKEDFFIMDGPIYPKQLMYWMVVPSEEVRIRYDPSALKILQNYIDIMDHAMDNSLPLVGFVKNPEDMQIVQTLKRKEMELDIPWLVDAQFFKNVLHPSAEDSRNCITYTNWFMQPNQFYENMLQTTSPLMDSSLSHKYAAEDYALTFFVIYVPAMNVLFKVESPYGLTKDDDMRHLLTRKVLYDISIGGIPPTLSKVDSIAKIRTKERKQILGQFSKLRVDTKYNDIRWSDTDG